MVARGPLCVGIDPHPGLLSAWDLPLSAAGVERFARTVVEAVGPSVAAVKPQSAFFEVFGSAGIAVLERVLADCRDVGTLSVLDAKRGDIGSTMAAYATAYLTGDGPLAADSLTVSPFLGFGSLAPAVEAALASGRGLFVLALTSNPEGPQVQHAVDESGRTVAATIAAQAAEINVGADPLGSIGLVVGATIGSTDVDLAAVNGPLLAPGLGAQGATAEDLQRVFGDARRNVLATSSRDVLQHGPSVGGLRDAAARVVEQVRAAVGS
ncbi:orotidine-5'-phosphate decarboxylase [Nakamurella flava]|uniref:Orotidine 5'-phosphate decarboxylase n=2 Tax=Nakamurella flava TaxID=2576308 RepID=A0A4U6QPV6_9ACTN|nr:orotidine-5'-phosphate decarboxylase [Nakamurella flava]